MPALLSVKSICVIDVWSKESKHASDWKYNILTLGVEEFEQEWDVRKAMDFPHTELPDKAGKFSQFVFRLVFLGCIMIQHLHRCVFHEIGKWSFVWSD
jgi:hypothetical protein